MSQKELEAIKFLFRPGTRVRYMDSTDRIQVQWEGTVNRVEPSVNDALVYVNLDGVGEKPILSRFLEKI